jgi:hypothetical protein
VLSNNNTLFYLQDCAVTQSKIDVLLNLCGTIHIKRNPWARKPIPPDPRPNAGFGFGPGKRGHHPTDP